MADPEERPGGPAPHLFLDQRLNFFGDCPPHLGLHIQSTLPKKDAFGTSTTCPSYRESNKRSKERQGPTLGVRFTEVSVL